MKKWKDTDMKKSKKVKASIIILVFTIVLLISFLAFAKNNSTINTAPVGNLTSISTTDKAKVVIFTDYSGKKLSNLQSKIADFKTALNGNVDINIINDTETLGSGRKTEYQQKNVTVQQSYSYTPPTTINCSQGTLTGNLNKVGNYTKQTTREWIEPYSFSISTSVSKYFKWETLMNATSLFPATKNYSSGGCTGTYVLTGTDEGSPVYGDLKNSDGTVQHDVIIGANVTAYYEGTATHPGYWTTVTTYTQTYTGTIAGNVTIDYNILGVDTNKILNLSSNSESKKYAVFLSDSNSTDFSADWGNYFPFGDLNNSVKQCLQQNSYSMYSVMNMLDTNIYSTTGKQKYTVRQIMNSSPDTAQDHYCKDIDSCFDKIKSEISNSYINSNVTYICTDETINYTKSYSDFENDPKIDERWKYVHNPSIFNPNDGLFEYNDRFLDYPITQFDKSGEYKITYQVKDDPTTRLNFIGFNKWSTAENQMTIIVHHRPIADFITNINHSTLLPSITDKSYDKDHINETGKGIVERKWKWKLDEATEWIDGFPTSALQMGKTYNIGLQVKDKEGAWSHWTIKSFIVGQNSKPIAKFSMNNPMCKGSINNIDVQDSDPDSDPISETHWTIINKANNMVVPGFNNISSTPNLSNLDIGTYQISHWVKDSPQWGLPLASDVYTQDLTVVENVTLNAKIGTNLNNLNVSATAKQGQNIILSINTTGYVKFLTIYFPNEITQLDSTLPIKKTIPEEENHTEQITYRLPFEVPLTLDKDNNRLLPVYKILITGLKADGTSASAYVYLDVNGSILDGFRTCTINDNPK